MTNRHWLSPSEYAGLRGVHVNTVWRWLKTGALRGEKIGGLWFIAAGVKSEDEEDDGNRIGVPQTPGRPLGGGGIDRPTGEPHDDRPLRTEARQHEAGGKRA